VRGLQEDKVYSVSEINGLVRNLVEDAFPSVWVEGEIANYVRHSSGHLYFSLRDEQGQLRAVMFRGRNRYLRFEPENGLGVLARGALSVYERGGQYQIIVDVLQPAGVGALELAFQQIRSRLEGEGLFDPAHKTSIPKFPQRVGVVTSPTGAAIRDIVQVIGRRAPWIQVIVRPTRVQGEGAAADISCAVDEFNEYGGVEVLIVGRGGGSAEDLWPFNEETVARSIFRSRIPIISAVGHEIDHSIADLVADLRAPTPSAAAELVAPDRRSLDRELRRLRRRQAVAMVRRVRHAEREFRMVAGRWTSLNLGTAIAQRHQRVDELLNRLARSVSHRLDVHRRDVGALASRLNGVSPLAVLARGYCLCRRRPDMEMITRAGALAREDEVVLTFHEGEAVCSVGEIRTSREG